MTTNEERRKAAAMIRFVVPYELVFESQERTYSTFRFLLVNDLSRAIGCDENEVMERLIELIKPEHEQTCHNASTDGSNLSGWLFDFICSECGAHLYSEEMGHSPLWVDGDAEPISYCPNCGYKVVE